MAESDLWPRRALSTVILGENGAGKSTLLRLILSSLVCAQPRPGAYTKHVAADQGVGHVVLEWRHSQTGDQLITGRIMRSRPDVPGGGRSVAWYSFQPSAVLGLESLPFDNGDPPEDVSSFRDRLHAALQSGDCAGLTWVWSYQEWVEVLRGQGFNVRWLQWMADHPMHDGTAGGRRTDERFIVSVVCEVIALQQLAGRTDEYATLRHLVSRESEVADELLLAAQQSAVTVLDNMIEKVLATLEDVQRLSRLPDGVSHGLGGNEFFRITCRRRDQAQRTNRLAAALDDAVRRDTAPDTSRLLVQGLREVADIGIEICVPNGFTSASARYLSLSHLNALSGGEAAICQLVCQLVIGVVVARLARTRVDEAPERLGVIALDDQFGRLTPRAAGLFLELVSALGVQLLCTSPRLDPDLFVRFSSIVKICTDRDTLRVRIAYPAGFAPASDKATSQDAGLTGVLDSVPLEDVFEVHEGAVRAAHGEPDSRDVATADVLTAGDLQDRVAERRPFPRVPQHKLVHKLDLLRPGDFVVSRMWDRGPVPIRVVSPDEPPTVASEALLVLRPRRPLRPAEEFFYLRFMRSDQLLGALSGQDGLVVITPGILTRQRIPRPDSATLNAITELTGAAECFGAWQRDANDAINSFFQWTDLPAARSHMIEAGRLTRQRREAASVANELGARLRATLPYPIARRWREVQAARPDDAGYALVLDCAEAAVAYCAVLGVVFAHEAQTTLHRVSDMRRRVRRGNAARMTFGTWHNILREVSEIATAQNLPSDSPLTQFRCFTDVEVAGAIRALHDRRNEKSHRRGPAVHEINDAVVNARGHLETVLSRIEWLVDYPLRTIETCHWDSFTSTSQVSYRELMGDHSIVSPGRERITQILEIGSPYITDSYGNYRLMRPFLLVQPCPQCGQLTIFILDQWNAANQETEYLALDHSDTITVTDMQTALQQVGLL